MYQICNHLLRLMVRSRLQIELKKLLCNLRNTRQATSNPLKPEHLCLGVGSDEIIDGIFRCFCTPAHDKILTCPPTYGMYAHSAQVNDLKIIPVNLDTASGFGLRPRAVNEMLFKDPSIKVVLLCTPGNPAGTLLAKSDIQQILEHPTWNGVVVVDEAYIDFAPEFSSIADWVTEWPNLIVIQTLSKAFGLAGLRLGAAFSSPGVVQLLNNLKAPYNISSPTVALAFEAFQPHSLAVMKANRLKIFAQRDRLLAELPKVPGVGKFRGGSDSNFLLVEMLNKPVAEGGVPDNQVALAVYQALAVKAQIIVRYRGKEPGCLGCLRITVGTEEEVDGFLSQLKTVLAEVYTNMASKEQD